jgi:hypothetical protein
MGMKSEYLICDNSCKKLQPLFFTENTMREFARHIYKAKQWARVRQYILQRDDGLCTHCGAPGKIVHHKVWVTPKNCNDPAIAFGENNLELVCEQCHGRIHEGDTATQAGLRFDAMGNLVKREEQG